MAMIDWQCPWCGATNSIEEVQFRAANSITCEQCNTIVDVASDSSLTDEADEQ